MKTLLRAAEIADFFGIAFLKIYLISRFSKIEKVLNHSTIKSTRTYVVGTLAWSARVNSIYIIHDTYNSLALN